MNVAVSKEESVFKNIIDPENEHLFDSNDSKKRVRGLVLAKKFLAKQVLFMFWRLCFLFCA
jgi:hypothetical protein